MNIVIQNIETVRKSKGVTKTHIAKHCGKTSSWYGDISHGKKRLSVDDLILVADALNENPSIFFASKLSVTLKSNKSA
ncbi:helix-turn-helix domain-containing protein [Paenibacillus oryzisoli]|uniref:helix-turn-helix domain-containing protein n=1 Tax=Paenibacillus oryzisoli TaxID=1850517 RepID=UPI0009EDBD61|nr:helix-turn-helix domain-containing protein [Paenibacillus oryzisoli]